MSFHVSKYVSLLRLRLTNAANEQWSETPTETTLGLSIKGSSSDSLIIGGGLIPLGGMVATPLGLR